MALVYDDDDDVHVSSYPWQSQLWRKKRASRRALITTGRDTFPVSAYLLAVVSLQRIWRGILLRRRVLKKFLDRSFERQWRVDERAVTSVYLSVPRANESQFVVLAKRVQARWRTALLRKEYVRWERHESWPIFYVAAATIQRAWVDYQFLKKNKKHKTRSKRFFTTKEDASAGKIQNLWRAFVNRQVFAFYRQLIKFREKGDPMLMLKCIDPQEAAMMDPAAGLHVRFRMTAGEGATGFPPRIVYKVFTHNNVADVCSFAPKDYTRARKNLPPQMIHNTTHSDVVERLKEMDRRRMGWYRRIDNNPWKFVSDSVLQNADDIAAQFVLSTPSMPKSNSAKSVISIDDPFHYSRLRRKENREKKNKEIRRKWLAELYAGEQASRGDRSPHDVRREAHDLFAAISDADVDQEVNRLVDWTSHLDFESYRRDWLGLAATAPTDALIPKLNYPSS